MRSKIYLHEHPDFTDLIRVVADERKIDPYLAEKDYWLMHCLYGLKLAGYEFQLKGGTSLSKGYGIIHRFSEDIDIHIAPPEGRQIRTSQNHDKEKDRQGRKDYYDYLASSITIPGIVKIDRDTLFDIPPKYFSGGIRLYYESKFSSDGSAKEGILLEVGFDDVIPNQPLEISSWAMDFALEKRVDVIDSRALQIHCYDPGYTLVEKLQAIATKYRQHQSSGDKFPPNFMRHYYDVFCLLQNSGVQAFIGTDQYIAHKNRRFPGIDRQKPLIENEAFVLGDNHTRVLYQKEYQSRAALYYQGQPPFDKVLAVILKNLARL
ncbi:nucleotidyl transferase AbiEii/AbiGii toxin family protein [Methylomonas sp. AM2-LC]|uniref:nucleotidyl transferase AbiEii/AbiGii toxin family protein n=1 Tax=Methylomonas sp. AM2-LC TaxID=3153301 RepID=UPI003265E0D8